MDWSIQEIARLAGTTSRTLRHYDDVGVLPPSRIGANGYRYYDALALTRLQRILMLRDLGLGLAAIAAVLDGQSDTVAALATHVRWLEAERDRLTRQISSVETTITTLAKGGQLMADDMLDGFDHTVYRDEVAQRWGADAAAASDSWWTGTSREEKGDFAASSAALIAEWTDAVTRGLDPTGAESQAIARRHVRWLGSIPGTPGYPSGPTKEYLEGLGELYVSDERFAATYAGAAGFVRAALQEYAERNL
jgi:DNA-binding transcriptional MerR regulator